MERRVSREMSPDRAKMCAQTKVMKPTFKKIQVVYYLSRNGNLEHPHYIEVTHLANQHLRLKDVLDRLTVLRGKGMPSLYTWSCKRSYKNGYVWNDLAQNDVIYPSEGGEYVLKGSELVMGCTEKLHHLQIGNVPQFQLDNSHQTGQDSNYHPKRRFTAPKRQINHQETMRSQYDHHPDEEIIEEEEEYENKTVHTRCSRGVSTEETEEEFKPKDPHKKITHTELSIDANSSSSPPSTASSTLSDNANAENNTPNDQNCKRFEDGDPVANEPMLSRNSMLFSLIACGGSGSFRKTVLPPNVRELPPLPPLPPGTAARKSGSGISLHKGVICKGKMDEDRVIISYMSENPRFGNLQAEEKEYFSGSIVESITNDERLVSEPGLKKSSSYNQERSSKGGLGAAAAAAEEEVKKEKGVKGKCLPRKMKKKSTSKQPQK